MKTITSLEFQTHMDKYLTQAQQEEIIITLENGELLQLSPVDAEDLADATLENDPRFIDLIQERRQNYKQRGGIPFAQVQQELIDELIQDLNHPDPQVRYEAVRHLVTLGEAALPALQKAIK